MGLRVPELVLVELDRAMAAGEPDPELAEPLERSAGINLGLDYLPGSITFDALADSAPDPLTASKIVLFDAFATNVDRTPRNPNLLSWHGSRARSTPSPRCATTCCCAGRPSSRRRRRP
jgi:hypothetical protein